MGKTTCTRCGFVWRWDGKRPAEALCGCGGTLRGRASPNKGKRLTPCVLCDRRQPPEKLQHPVAEFRGVSHKPAESWPAGSPVCREHALTYDLGAEMGVPAVATATRNDAD